MTAEEVGSGSRDNECDAHSVAGGGGDNNGITAGLGNKNVVGFVIDCAGSATDVDVVFEPFWK